MRARSWPLRTLLLTGEIVVIVSQHGIDSTRRDQAAQGQGCTSTTSTRDEEAVDYLRRTVLLHPDAGSAHSQLASALRRLGRSEEALAHFQRAVELMPDDMTARANLGQMLLSLNRPDAAVPHCHQAVQLQPNVAVLHLILGDALRCAGRFAEAHTAYLEALRLEPTLPQAHANLALNCRPQGLSHEAFAPLRKAVSLQPDNATFWRYLGEVSAEAGRVDEAAQCLARAGVLDPTSASVQVALGTLHEQCGETAQAEACFRAALRLQPDHTPAQVHLASLLGKRLPAEDLAAMSQRLADPGVDASSRIDLHFALAGVRDSRGECAAAAAHARQANTLCLEQARLSTSYLPEEHTRFVSAVQLAFGPGFFERVRGGGLATERPVFVFGLPRSGTTLVEQILASHPDVHGAGELSLGWKSVAAIPQVLGRGDDPLACVPQLDTSAVNGLAQQHLGWLDAVDEGRARRIVDKLPENYLNLGLLAAMFPQATFIHCRRDLRDIALSCWMTNFRWLRWSNDAGHIRARFEEYGRMMEHWQRGLPVKVYELRYEDLVNDLEETARGLVAACQLEWDPACLEFHRKRRSVRTASAAQVRQPIYKHAVGRWRNYEHEVPQLFTELMPPP